MTAVIRDALARRNASIMINSSIKLWFVGGDVDCTTYTSSPRTFSSILTKVSPSGKDAIVHLPKAISIDLAIALANGGFDVPLKIFTTISLNEKSTRRWTQLQSAQDCNSRLCA